MSIDYETALMSAYAVAHLRSVTFGPDIVEYLQRIDATLAPYDVRTENSTGWVVLIDGVPTDHRATDILDATRVGQ